MAWKGQKAKNPGWWRFWVGLAVRMLSSSVNERTSLLRVVCRTGKKTCLCDQPIATLAIYHAASEPLNRIKVIEKKIESLYSGYRSNLILGTK